MPSDNQHIRPDETVDAFLGRLIDEELERQGISAPAPTPAPVADSAEQIRADFPWLYGKKEVRK